MKWLVPLAASIATSFVVLVASAGVRPLSDTEMQALLRVARTSQVENAYAETRDDQTVLLYAIVIHRGVQIRDGSCIALTIDYMVPPESESRWEPVFDSVAYRYWPNNRECDVKAPGSIRLKPIIDTETLGRIFRATPRILEAIGGPIAGDARRLVSVGVTYDEVDRTYLYTADYAGSEDCSGVSVTLRVRDEVELVRVIPTICETRRYRESVRQ